MRLRTGAIVEALPLDVSDFGAHAAFGARAAEALAGKIDGVVFCQGFMAEQAEAEKSPELVRRTAEVNHASVVALVGLLGPRLTRPGGFVCAVSSVAGDRGRPSNFIYGSSKAALNVAMDGLRAALFREGVSVTVIKPGFVDTSMTWGLRGMFLVASPERVARDIERAIARRSAVAYTPWFWRWIMLIIRSIPAPVFHRIKL